MVHVVTSVKEGGEAAHRAKQGRQVRAAEAGAYFALTP